MSTAAGTPVVRLTHVSIGYGDRAVVRDVSFTVTDGEVVALLGANGSGKTTLVRGMLDLATVMAGDIELLGRRIGHRRDRADIGYVPQRHTVGGAIPSTVREVVASGRLSRLGFLGRLGVADRQAVDAAIDAVHLTAFAATDVADLSGGQQRRVLIARALAAEPRVLIMDEPTAGVDQVSQQALATAISGLADAGIPMIIVTHEVDPLADVLTRAIVLTDGQITYDGPPPTRSAHDAADHHHLPEPGTGAGWLDHPLGGQ